MRWEILGKGDIIKTLLKNRGIKDEKEFFSPKDPEKIKIESLGVDKSALKAALKRIESARKSKEKAIVYGDYDADGISGTAILWEALYGFGLDVLPYIPNRFDEGYGINPESIESLKSQFSNLKLIVTIDNGIVAYTALKKAKELGIDLIIIDHHVKGDGKLNMPYVVHSTLVSGSALAYLFAHELFTRFKIPDLRFQFLELAAIGTIADQLPLTGVNRSVVKYGLSALNESKRVGLRELFKEAGIQNAGTYEVNYIIAPRINAMGRLSQGIDSLRLLCTKNTAKAKDLAKLLGNTNQERQRIVDEVVLETRKMVTSEKVIVLANESYHEGVIGLAAGKLTEEFYRPAIVLSKKGKISKASARSISGFNIIENIRKLKHLIIEGGGHPMAAGFSIETSKIEEFTKEINVIADELLSDEMLERKIKIDLEIGFDEINTKLYERLKLFEPFGLGNPAPTFVSRDVEVIDFRLVGREGKHLKLKLMQNGQIFHSIYFGGGKIYPELKPSVIKDVVYQIEDNSWNGTRSLQLKIKDVN